MHCASSSLRWHARTIRMRLISPTSDRESPNTTTCGPWPFRSRCAESRLLLAGLSVCARSVKLPPTAKQQARLRRKYM